MKPRWSIAAVTIGMALAGLILSGTGRTARSAGPVDAADFDPAADLVPRDADQALDWLSTGLNDLGAHAAGHNVPLLYEPLNRYETNLFNRIGEISDGLIERLLCLWGQLPFQSGRQRFDQIRGILQWGSRFQCGLCALRRLNRRQQIRLLLSKLL